MNDPRYTGPGPHHDDWGVGHGRQDQPETEVPPNYDGQWATPDTTAAFEQPAGWAPPGNGPAMPAGPAPATTQSSSRTAVPVLAGIAGILAIAVIAGAVFLFTRGTGSDAEPAEAASPSVQATITETSTATATTTQTATATATAPAGSGRYTAGPGQYGVGLNTFEKCDNGGARAVLTGHETTSCPFATNVGEQLAGYDVGEGDVTTVHAYSPTTGKDYEMTCRQAQDSEYDKLWKCTGGVRAVVYVYP